MNDGSDSGELPRDFGDYALLRSLGRGGMGQVYLAKVRAKGLVGVDKLCVVKTLRATNDPEYQRRFVDEARLIVLLTHRNICHVFDAGCFEGQYYLAMEHINGREVRAVQKLAEDHRAALPVDVAIFVVKETLEALDAAHRMTHPMTGEPLRVVHRDVSPQNVMISSEGEVKLIDFGLAESSQKLERTAPRIVMGKIAYMAPEQARGDPGLDGRADQFAAGVLLYELLANARYYGDLAFDDVWRNSGRGGFVPAKLKDIEPALAAVIQKATAANREDRYASCGDMRAALQKVELARGALAGSRETRQALQSLLELAGETLPSLSSPEIKALPKAPAQQKASEPQPPKERTRTFRVRSISSSSEAPSTQIENLAAGEKTEIGFVIEGLEPQELPPALATGDAFRPVSLMSSGPSSSSALEAVMPAPDATTLAGVTQRPFISAETPTVPPREPTMVVRPRPQRPTPSQSQSLSTPQTPAAQTPSPTPTTLPAADGVTTPELAKPKRSPVLLAAAVGLVAVVVAVVFGLGSGGSSDVKDAGTVVAVVPVVHDAGVVVVAAKDAGVVVDVVKDAGTVVVEAVKDAGADDVIEIEPIENADAGKRIKRPKREYRELPPLPPETSVSVVTDRWKLLKTHCKDVACFAAVDANLPTAGDNPEARKKVLAEQQRCYDRCRRAPKL